MTEQRVSRLTGAVGLVLALVLIAGAVTAAYVSADGIPQQPHGFSGTVSTISPPRLVPQGTSVRAFVGAELRAETTVDAQGKYSLLVPGPGGMVTFRVAGVTAHQSATWVAGELYSDFNLTIDALPGPVYSLTISSPAGGSVTSPGQGTFSYLGGAVVNLVASLNAGYKFVNWTGNVATIANPNAASTTITMQGDYSITANFQEGEPPDRYDLTVSSTSGGSVTTPGEGTFTYDEGTVVSLVATPGTGYQFINWTGNVTTIAKPKSASTTISMHGNYSITANFQEDEPAPPSSKWCFIATAAYDTPMAEEIQVLREFRDAYLLTNPLGETFVDLYYRVSPPVAEFITEHPVLKPLVRVGLQPAVAMSTVAVNTSPAEKAALTGLWLLLSAAVALWMTRHRGEGPEYTSG